jgi:hypothetical protein
MLAGTEVESDECRIHSVEPGYSFRYIHLYLIMVHSLGKPGILVRVYPDKLRLLSCMAFCPLSVAVTGV